MGEETDRIRLKLAGRHWGPRRVAVTLAGFAVVLAGLVLLMLPGPGLVLVGVGLAILATEFVWAWRAQRFVRTRARHAGHHARRRVMGRGRTRPRR